jgi:hypothetical protein
MPVCATTAVTAGDVAANTSATMARLSVMTAAFDRAR